MIRDAVDTIVASHVACLTDRYTQFVDISAEIVQHGVLLSKYGRSTGFPVGPIVHPALAGTLGLDESEN